MLLRNVVGKPAPGSSSGEIATLEPFNLIGQHDPGGAILEVMSRRVESRGMSNIAGHSDDFGTAAYRACLPVDNKCRY